MDSVGSDVYVHRCKIVVRTVYGNSRGFGGKSGYAPLSPLLFVIVMEAMSRDALPLVSKGKMAHSLRG